MNLYEISFKHYAPKGSREGTVCYLLAESDEEVYEWFKSGIESFTEYNHYTMYSEYESDGTEHDGTPFKESIISTKGCMNNEFEEVYDLYYGATQYSWELVSKYLDLDDIDTLKILGIKVANARDKIC